jgi:hypothetical protein
MQLRAVDGNAAFLFVCNCCSKEGLVLCICVSVHPGTKFELQPGGNICYLNNSKQILLQLVLLSIVIDTYDSFIFCSLCNVITSVGSMIL